MEDLGRCVLQTGSGVLQFETESAAYGVCGGEMVTLEELRIELVDRVRNCPNLTSIAQLIADAEAKLHASRIGEQSRRAFWDAVDHDLVVVTQEASVILERQGAQTLRTTIGAARAALTRYRNSLPDPAKRSVGE